MHTGLETVLTSRIMKRKEHAADACPEGEGPQQQMHPPRQIEGRARRADRQQAYEAQQDAMKLECPDRKVFSHCFMVTLSLYVILSLWTQASLQEEEQLRVPCLAGFHRRHRLTTAVQQARCSTQRLQSTVSARRHSQGQHAVHTPH